MTTSSSPLATSPSAGAPSAFEVLDACHRQTIVMLGRLSGLVSSIDHGGPDREAREAAEEIIQFFSQTARQHHEDEERHVFPRVLAAPDAPAAHDAVRRLQQDHLQMQAAWAQLRGPLAALAAGDASAFGAAQVDAAARFRALYEAHAQTEESLVFPLAGRLLDEREWRAAGAEMAARRGVVPPQGNGE